MNHRVRTALVHIVGSLTTEPYVNQIVLIVVRQVGQAAPGTLFQQKNALLHVTRRSLNNVDSFDMLPWSTTSADLSPMERVWELMARELHRRLP